MHIHLNQIMKIDQTASIIFHLHFQATHNPHAPSKYMLSSHCVYALRGPWFLSQPLRTCNIALSHLRMYPEVVFLLEEVACSRVIIYHHNIESIITHQRQEYDSWSLCVRNRYSSAVRWYSNNMRTLLTLTNWRNLIYLNSVKANIFWHIRICYNRNLDIVSFYIEISSILNFYI